MPADGLSNSNLTLRLGPIGGRWSATAAHDGGPSLVGAQVGATFRARGSVRQHFASGWAEVAESRAEWTWGELRILRAIAPPAPSGPSLEVEFALPESPAMLLWRLTARNRGHESLHLDSLELAVVGPAFSPRDAGEVNLGGDLAFFTNGYQSWSFAGTLNARDRMPVSRFGPLGDPKHLNLATPRERAPGDFTSETFGAVLSRERRAGILVGFLSQREQFGAIEVRLDAEPASLRLFAQCDGVLLPPGAERCTDWACLQFLDLSNADPLADYLQAVAQENRARVPDRVPVGWCSWYQYFTRIGEETMLSNLAAAHEQRDRLPLEFFQLDDGFEPRVGDWFETNAKFPHGLKWLADRVRDRGLTPGLWLAPFIATSDSRVLRDRPDWFIHDDRGRLANAGYNWWKWSFGLDPTHPGVQDHVRRLIEIAVRDWGFPYLKLDFLYAAALPGRRYDATRTRAGAMRLGLELIRDAAGPETFLLGCGCPLGSAIGIVDGMRIGTDVDPHWSPYLFHRALSPLVRDDPAYVSTRNALRNTLFRAPMHRRWWLNDPDCLLVRDRDTELSLDEVICLATAIALTGGMLLVSDDLTRLSTERRRIVESLMPVIGKSAAALDWADRPTPETLVLPLSGAVGDWALVGLFNWGERPSRRVLDLSAFGLPQAAGYWVNDFWTSALGGLDQADATTGPGDSSGSVNVSVPAHGARLLAIRSARPDGPQFVGSTLHFSQGCEISAWQVSGCELQASIALGRTAQGEVRLWLPRPPVRAEVDGAPTRPRPRGDGIWAVPVNVRQESVLAVSWGS